ncbi:hypothetical protein E2C01_012988 [Portunus trituberculatus]|uniref:Uncharacterized protein n=1 Tax=Portunus trituberculatus TaxID=210409 RepID=A0A5B7DFG7_PORTR|nr:hypothetical protein [Portunus trituberculatus]
MRQRSWCSSKLQMCHWSPEVVKCSCTLSPTVNRWITTGSLQCHQAPQVSLSALGAVISEGVAVILHCHEGVVSFSELFFGPSTLPSTSERPTRVTRSPGSEILQWFLTPILPQGQALGSLSGLRVCRAPDSPLKPNPLTYNVNPRKHEFNMKFSATAAQVRLLSVTCLQEVSLYHLPPHMLVLHDR